MNFFAELKRRNVYRVAIAYAVIGWLVIQVGSTVLALTGERELALEQLTALSRLPGGPSYGELMLDPESDSLRSDSEFQTIIASLAPKAAEENSKK